jgi:hypothetical protein
LRWIGSIVAWASASADADHQVATSWIFWIDRLSNTKVIFMCGDLEMLTQRWHAM